MIRGAMWVALMAASSLIAVPANAQIERPASAVETPESRLFNMGATLENLDRRLYDASYRCDAAGMERLKAEAAQLASETRQAIAASRAAGSFSALPRSTVERAETALNYWMPLINARQPLNCPPQSAQPPQVVVPAPVVQPQTAQDRAAQDELRARDRERVRDQQRLLDDAENVLINGENARLAGRCEERDDLAGIALVVLGRAQALLPEGDADLAALRVRAAALRDAPCPPPGAAAAPTSQISAGVSYFNRQAPVTGAGVRILPGNERFGAVLLDRVNGYAADVSATFGLNSTTDSGLTFGGRIALSDDRAAAQITPSSGSVGSVYHDRAPNGSTGINLGTTGLDAAIDRETRDFGIDVGYSRRLTSRLGQRDAINRLNGIAVTGGVKLQYESFHTDLDLSLRSPTFPTITMDARQEVRQSNLGISVGLNLDSAWDNSGAEDSKPRGGVVWSGQVDVTAYRADSNLRSMQHNVCGVCSVAERDFTINISDDDKRWGFGAEAGLELGYRFPGGFEIGVNGAVGYRSQVAGVHNPETGDDLFIRNQPTQLRFSDSYRYQAGIYSRMRF